MSVTLRIKKPHIETITEGCPWVMRHQAVESSQWMAAPSGSLCRVESERGEFLGLGMANGQSQIVCRILTRAQEIIDVEWFSRRLELALKKREGWYDVPYYRLVHAEADGLPGLVVDRFDDVCVVQVASAGMEIFQPLWQEALQNLLRPKAILLRNDFPARKLEGLPQEVRVLMGDVPSLVEVYENGCIYFADLWKGQKTGWFYDMRDNRQMIAQKARGKKVLDVFSHSGGFGLLAAMHGAAEVTMVDASVLALSLAQQAADRQGLSQCITLQGDAQQVMQNLVGQGRRYDVVIADPPAYVKSKKDIASGMRGYEKVARLAAPLVAEGGVFFTASCSHHASHGAFQKAVLEGVKKAGRKADVLKQTGASRDHPRHPHLPQGDYLKGLLLQF